MAEMKAVQFDRFGDVDVLEVRLVPRPTPQRGRVIVKVKAAGINPGEASIRKGLLEDAFPTTFPSGEGSDLAGIIAEVGDDVTALAPGDEVLGFSNERGSHAEYVSVPVDQLTAKPGNLAWDVAGSLFVAGTTAYAAVHAVGLGASDTVVVSGATGGVGTIGVQLARRTGATVIGIAGAGNDEWLSAHDVIPINYGDDLADRLSAAAPSGKIDAFLDFFGDGYVKLAVEALGVSASRVNSIIDFAAVREFGTKSAGNADAATAAVLAELAQLVADGRLEVPIEGTYPLSEVRDAFTDLEKRHSRGKIVLRP